MKSVMSYNENHLHAIECECEACNQKWNKMSGECDKCGEQIMSCSCNEIPIVSRKNCHNITVKLDWIDINESTPKNDYTPVLVCNIKGWMLRPVMAMYHESKNCFVSYNPHQIDKYVLEVTHWFPIPELPIRRDRE